MVQLDAVAMQVLHALRDLCQKLQKLRGLDALRILQCGAVLQS